MFKTIEFYLEGMNIYEKCHPPTWAILWQAFQDEVTEFKEKPSLDEFWDSLHSGGKCIYFLTRIPIHLLAFPTVKKHSLRYQETNCVRSSRNCQGKCCLLNQSSMKK